MTLSALCVLRLRSHVNRVRCTAITQPLCSQRTDGYLPKTKFIVTGSFFFALRFLEKLCISSFSIEACSKTNCFFYFFNLLKYLNISEAFVVSSYRCRNYNKQYCHQQQNYNAHNLQYNRNTKKTPKMSFGPPMSSSESDDEFMFGGQYDKVYHLKGNTFKYKIYTNYCLCWIIMYIG